MKVIKISATSWHYRLASVYGDFRRGDDFCCYFWNMVKGALIATLTLISICIVAVPATDAVIWGIVALQCGCGVSPSVLGILFVVEFGLIAGVAFIMAIVVGIASLWTKSASIASDSVVGQSYRSWRDKYCNQVDVQ